MYTSGSVLILSPADFGLLDYLAPGSNEQQTLQITINAMNNSNVAIAPEVLVISSESGIFITEGGQSSIQSGLLSPNIILDVKSKPVEITSDAVKEEVGGSLSNKNPLAAKHMKHLHRHKKMGGSMSAGSVSAGARVEHKLKKYIV